MAREKVCAIYGLLPQGTERVAENVRYVGKMCDTDRPRKHGTPKNMLRLAHLPVVRWIAKLREGGSDYDWMILHEWTGKDGLSEVEVAVIATMKALGCDLLNLTRGGEGTGGVEVSEETRRRLSRAFTGKKRAPFSEEWRRKLSEAGRSRTISQAQRDALLTGQRAGLRPVVTHDGKTFSSAAEAARSLRIDSGMIASVLKGRRSHVAGIGFRYANDPRPLPVPIFNPLKIKSKSYVTPGS